MRVFKYLLLAGLLAFMAQSKADLKLVFNDGSTETYNYNQIEVSSNGAAVARGVSRGSTSSSSTSSASSEHSSSSNSSVSGCDVPPNTVLAPPPFKWEKSTGVTKIDLPRSDVWSFPITTGNNPKYRGQLSVGGYSWTSGVNHKVWFSKCPNGEPLSPYCVRTGGTTGIYWAQESRSGYCALPLSEVMYINFQNYKDTCTKAMDDLYGCHGYLHHKITGEAYL